MTKNSPIVAIVDDDPSVLKAIARLLRTRSFAARTFQSGAQFLASLAEGLPDCLILDLQMPGMSGLDVQNRLAQTGVQIPTVVMTAYNEPGMRERCQSAGAIAFLSKPLSQSLLFAAIEADAAALLLNRRGQSPSAAAARG